eukprot:988396-Rhodomonas_salina.3
MEGIARRLLSKYVPTRLCAYALATHCPVLTCGMLLQDAHGRRVGRVEPYLSCYAFAMRCPDGGWGSVARKSKERFKLLPLTVLRACYAVSGRGERTTGGVALPIMLRISYAVSGADIGSYIHYAIRGTVILTYAEVLRNVRYRHNYAAIRLLSGSGGGMVDDVEDLFEVPPRSQYSIS